MVVDETPDHKILNISFRIPMFWKVESVLLKNTALYDLALSIYVFNVLLIILFYGEVFSGHPQVIGLYC